MKVFQRFPCAVTEQRDDRLKITTQAGLLSLLFCPGDLHFYKVTEISVAKDSQSASGRKENSSGIYTRISVKKHLKIPLIL